MSGSDKIKDLKAYDLRFPTSLEKHGSDAMNKNRIMFKQFCQIDSCRVGGVSENVAIMLMAKKFGVPVCPHAGGIGLCEYVQHLCIFDYIAISGSLEKRMTEYTSHLHEFFVDPVQMKNGCYVVPKNPGYSIEMTAEAREQYLWPTGGVWDKLIKDGTYKLTAI